MDQKTLIPASPPLFSIKSTSYLRPGIETRPFRFRVTVELQEIVRINSAEDAISISNPISERTFTFALA
ncbi:hypothetical protein CRI94_01190 [Longibacter salinarum]|uniref:Uncharacterized protein n=1 Tax=Longibacter salinarum TaxID=1850348 RepID=A0A2A8D1Z1_9BACT|nr:hypothetical protein CRI94_01190 [Longibacter salinarum]